MAEFATGDGAAANTIVSLRTKGRTRFNRVSRARASCSRSHRARERMSMTRFRAARFSSASNPLAAAGAAKRRTGRDALVPGARSTSGV